MIIHPTEKDIQDYADSGMTHSKAMIATHLIDCEICRQKIQIYQRVIKAVIEKEKPSFEPGLATRVLAQLSQKARRSSDKYWSLLFVSLIILVTIVCIALRRQLFLGNIRLNQYSLGILAAGALMILLFMLADMWFGYHKRLDRLKKTGLRHSSCTVV